MNAKTRKDLLGVAVIGGLITLLGYVAARERTCANVLLSAFFVLGVGLAGLLLAALSITILIIFLFFSNKSCLFVTSIW